MRQFDIVAFDADDTLWHSEDGFHANEQRFVQLVAPYAAEGVDVKAALTAVERKNLSIFGYGVKAFGLSAVEAAITITEGRIPTAVIGELVGLIRDQISDPVRLLPGVPDVLAKVARHYRLVLITKGDLIHQTHKIETSGLATTSATWRSCWRRTPPPTTASSAAWACRPRPCAWWATACAATSCR